MRLSPTAWPAGQITVAGRADVNCGLFGETDSPAGCACDALQFTVAHVVPGGDWSLPSFAKYALNRVPAEAVVSFEPTVLLTKFTASASRSDTPPPSHPATLLTM